MPENYDQFKACLNIVMTQTNYNEEMATKKLKEWDNDFIKVIKSFTSVHTLLSSESSDDGKSLKNSYDIIMKEKYESKDLIQELSKLKNITELVVVAGKSDIDY